MIRWFASHPTAANLLMLVLLFAGLFALPGVKRETFPDFTRGEVQASAVYPGASTEEVEEALCQRLEDAIEGIADLDEIRCEAREGQATAVARMREGADIARFEDDVSSAVDAIDTFPEAVERPVVEQLGRLDPVVSIAITGPMNAPDLEVYADEIKRELTAREHVQQVEVTGFSDRQFRVEVAAENLRQFDLSMSELADTVARQSVNLPAGSIETDERELRLRFDDERTSVHALESLVVIGSERGGVIRLGDIARITERFEYDEDAVLFGGERAAVLKVSKTKDEDTLDVFSAVEAYVEEVRERAPPGVQFTLTDDLSSIVKDRLTMLLKNGWQGLVLVFAVLWLFFRARLAFWVTMGLPVSFLGGLFVMALAGYSINMISMVALLIALGLLMDDAIVVAENVATHLQRGVGALEAAIEGTREVLPGVMASFTTTVVIFGPLAFLVGDIGKVLRVMPVVLIIVLAVSLIEAFWILPNHLAHALSVPQAPSRFRTRFDAFVEWVRERIVGRTVDFAIARRYVFAGAVLALLMASVGMVAGARIQFEAFPELDGDVVEARLLLPQGTPLARTEQAVQAITDALERVNAQLTPMQPGGAALIERVAVYYNVNQDANEVGTHVASVKADLLPAETRNARIDDVLNRWRESTGELTDVIALNFKEPSLGPAGRAIEVRLAGEDLDELKAASTALIAWFDRFEGVYDLSDDLRAGKPELTVSLRDDAPALGFDARMIASQLRDAYQGVTAIELQVDAQAYEVDVRLAASDRDGLVDLDRFRLIGPQGEQVPLSAVADVSESRGVARIQRFDGRRTVTVTGDVDTRRTNALAVLEQTQAEFVPGLERDYPGIKVSFEGQSDESAKTGGSLARGFLIGIIGVFVLLSFQFRSYVEPIVVMAVIPMALIGVIWGHWLMGLNLSLPSVMGFVSLAGIVVNDSILLVEFLKRAMREGVEVEEAARRASRQRFRAVLLTSLTTIAGLCPLLLERSVQAQVLVPLVASIAFGLMATTMLVLFLVPALFAILHDLGLVGGHSPRADSGSADAAQPSA